MNTQRKGFTGSARLLLAGMLASSALSAMAQQAPAAAPAITKLTEIDVKQSGNPPTGRFAVVVEHDPGLPMHTIYRPRDLANTRHPVLIWGEGGCAKNGLMFTEFLSEIASHGFVVIADGPPGAVGAGRGGPNDPAVAGGPGGPGGPGAGPGGPRPAGAGAPGGPAPQGAGPGGARPPGGPGAAGPGGARPPGGPGAGPGGAGGAGAAPRGMGPPDGTDLIKGLDWLQAESTRAGSRFNGKVDTQNVAAMGMSCGGLMSYGASSDPRVKTVGIWNSGLVSPDQKIYEGLHGSVIIITGNESDVAYANGKRDFESLPAKVPVFYGVHSPVGHGGTYSQDNGGAFGPMAVAWLKWQLQGDRGATGRGYFVGDTCSVCKDSTWTVNSRSLP